MTTLTYREEMAFIHKAIRRELGSFPTIVRSVDEQDVERRRAAAEWISSMLSFLRHHHELEDEVLWPALRERLEGDVETLELLEKMEAQHVALHELTEQASAALGSWRAKGTPADNPPLATILELLYETAIEHLDVEEAQVCLLAERHVPAEVWGRMEKLSPKRTSGRAARDVGAALLEDANDRERAWALRATPTPVRWALLPLVERGYRKRISRIRGT